MGNDDTSIYDARFISKSNVISTKSNVYKSINSKSIYFSLSFNARYWLYTKYVIWFIRLSYYTTGYNKSIKFKYIINQVVLQDNKKHNKNYSKTQKRSKII